MGVSRALACFWRVKGPWSCPVPGSSLLLGTVQCLYLLGPSCDVSAQWLPVCGRDLYSLCLICRPAAAAALLSKPRAHPWPWPQWTLWRPWQWPVSKHAAACPMCQTWKHDTPKSVPLVLLPPVEAAFLISPRTLSEPAGSLGTRRSLPMAPLPALLSCHFVF